MLIVPELRMNFVLVPRTGTGSLYRECRRVYPRSMLLYRHAEAECVPEPYRVFETVGFVRHPLFRMVSLYKMLQTRDIWRPQIEGKTFEEWLTTNEELFAVRDHDTGGYHPVLHRALPIPENRKSAKLYLQPERGTTVLKFCDLPFHMEAWGLDPDFVANETSNDTELEITWSSKIEKHIAKYFTWDMENY